MSLIKIGDTRIIFVRPAGVVAELAEQCDGFVVVLGLPITEDAAGFINALTPVPGANRPKAELGNWYDTHPTPAWERYAGDRWRFKLEETTAVSRLIHGNLGWANTLVLSGNLDSLIAASMYLSTIRRTTHDFCGDGYQEPYRGAVRDAVADNTGETLSEAGQRYRNALQSDPDSAAIKDAVLSEMLGYRLHDTGHGLVEDIVSEAAQKYTAARD